MFELSEKVRPGAPPAIAAFQTSGIALAVLSGNEAGRVAPTALSSASSSSAPKRPPPARSRGSPNCVRRGTGSSWSAMG